MDTCVIDLNFTNKGIVTRRNLFIKMFVNVTNNRTAVMTFTWDKHDVYRMKLLSSSLTIRHDLMEDHDIYNWNYYTLSSLLGMITCKGRSKDLGLGEGGGLHVLNSFNRYVHNKKLTKVDENFPLSSHECKNRFLYLTFRVSCSKKFFTR